MVTGRRMPRGDRETTEIEDVDKSKSELDKYVPSIFQTEFRPREIRYPALKLSMPPNVVSYKNNYTCYERTEGSIDRKIFGPEKMLYCSRTIKENETEVGILVSHNLTQADMWWLCGDLKIRRNLQGVWKGQCTPINMVMPFKIIKGVAGDIKEELKWVKQLSRTKRAVTSPTTSITINKGSSTTPPKL